MTTRPSKQGAPSERAKAAMDVLRERYDQQVADLEKIADAVEKIAEFEAEVGVLAARSQDDGMSMSDLAHCTGVHPNRLHRLIDRHKHTTNE